MVWSKKRKHYGKNRYYSVAKKLRRDGKTTEEFEILMSGLMLEDVIALKLELASKAAGGALYGLPIYGSLINIVREATFKYALSACRTKFEAARFLGVDVAHFYKMVEKFSAESYFQEDEEK